MNRCHRVARTLSCRGAKFIGNVSSDIKKTLMLLIEVQFSEIVKCRFPSNGFCSPRRSCLKSVLIGLVGGSSSVLVSIISPPPMNGFISWKVSSLTNRPNSRWTTHLVCRQCHHVCTEFGHVDLAMRCTLAASRSTRAPFSWAIRIMSSIGFRTPRTFDVWTTHTSLPLRLRLHASISSVKSSLLGRSEVRFQTLQRASAKERCRCGVPFL